MKPASERSWWGRPSVAVAGFALAYAGIHYTASLSSWRGPFAPAWPAAGVLVAALLMLPLRAGLACLGLAILVTAAYHRSQTAAPWPPVVLGSIVTAGQFWLLAWLAKARCGGRVNFERLPDVVAFGLIAAVMNALGAMAVAILRAPHLAVGLESFALSRWATHGLALVIVTPLIVAWLTKPARPARWHWAHAIEAGVVLAAGLALLQLTRGPGLPPHPLVDPYVALVPLGWAAVRFGARGATLATAIVTAHLIHFADVAGRGSSPEATMHQFSAAAVYLGIMALTGLIVAAMIAEKDRALESAREQERRVRAMFENLFDALAVIRDGRIAFANPAFATLVGAAGSGELAGRSLAEFVRAEDHPLLDRTLASGPGSRGELQGRRCDGGTFAMELRCSHVPFDGQAAPLVLCRDLTAEVKAQREIARVNRAWRTLGRCNHAVSHASDEATLLEAVCRLAVEVGGYRLAWVGYAGDDERKSVRVMAQSGSGQAYVEDLQVSWSDTPHGHGPTGTAIRTGEAVICQNILEDPRLAPWHERAACHGVRSSAAFPLLHEGRPFGALSLYSSDPEAFDAHESGLLMELANELVFGIETQRTRVRHRQSEAEVRRLLAEAEQVRSGLLSILEDRQVAEKALAASEERYRGAMHGSAIGMALLDLEGRWLEVNPVLCRMLGYSRDELVGREAAALTHADDVWPGPDEQLWRLGYGSENYQREKRYRHRSGEIVWVRVHISLVRDGDGRPRHYVSQVENITARKQAEASLEAAAERLAIALRASKFGVWRHNLQTRVTEWDARTFGIFGLPPASEAPSLERILATVVDEDRERVRRSWEVRPDCDHDYQIRFRVAHPGGTLRHVELHAIVHDDPQGRAEWSIGVAGDITEIVDATAESERLRLQLQQAQKMEALGSLAAGVAHDFNNILAGVNGFVELASTTLEPEHEAFELLNQARKGAMSGRNLVRRILDFSRGGAAPQKCLLDLGEVVRETAPLVAAGLPANVSLSLDLDGGRAPVVADPGQLQQILLNLCANAAHAIGSGAGRIELGVVRCELGSGPDIPPGCRPGPHVRLTVRDTGCGMNAATLARIFEPYFTTKAAGQGTGLGLAIVKDIVVAHGGGMRVESVLGHGTVFTLFLPRARPPVAGEASHGATPQRGRGRRILVVDDESPVAAVVCRSLQRCGHSVESFTSPASAWERLAGAPSSFDLLIVDQNMPEMSGLDFARRARGLIPELAVVLMSGRLGAHESRDPAVTSTIPKPFEMDELLAAVGAALDETTPGQS